MALVKGLNSYVDIDEAELYFEDRLNADAWSSANFLTKEKALVTATSMIDGYQFVGTALSPDQTLSFPRSGSYFDPLVGDYVILDENIPKRVQVACFETALHLLENPESITNTGEFKNFKLDDVLSVEYVTKAPKSNSFTKKQLKPLLINQGSNLWWRAN